MKVHNTTTLSEFRESRISGVLHGGKGHIKPPSKTYNPDVSMTLFDEIRDYLLIISHRKCTENNADSLINDMQAEYRQKLHRY